MRVKRKEKYGGVEGYGSFSLGDRACCHGAGPPIGGCLVQWHNSADSFIIEKFFLSSCLTVHTLLLHPSLFSFPLFHPLSLLSHKKKLMNYIRFIMSAVATTHFHSDTVTSAAQVKETRSSTNLLKVLEVITPQFTIHYVFIRQLRKFSFLNCACYSPESFMVEMLICR